MKSMTSARPKMVLTYWGGSDLLCVGDSRGDGLVLDFFCRGGGGDSFEEDLRCGPKLRVFVDLVELDEIGMTLLKIVEALRGAFFFSTSVELNTRTPGKEALAAK